MTVTAVWAPGGVTPGNFTPKFHQVILIVSDPDSVSPDPDRTFEAEYRSGSRVLMTKNWIKFTAEKNDIFCSVADPDLGSGAFLTPGSGMGKKIWIRIYLDTGRHPPFSKFSCTNFSCHCRAPNFHINGRHQPYLFSVRFGLSYHLWAPACLVPVEDVGQLYLFSQATTRITNRPQSFILLTCANLSYY